MPIVLVRIDDRLVHGQVVEGWLPSLKADRLLVVSDAAADDPMQRSLMGLALPEFASLEIVRTKEAVAAVRRAAAGSDRVLVLAPGPAEVLALIEGGAGFESVNVGGMHYEAGRVQLGKAIFLGRSDLEALAAIAAKGVRLEGRAVPSDESTDVLDLIRSRSS